MGGSQKVSRYLVGPKKDKSYTFKNVEETILCKGIAYTKALRQRILGSWWSKAEIYLENRLAAALKDLKGQTKFLILFDSGKLLKLICLCVSFEWKCALIIDAFLKTSKNKKGKEKV